VIWARLIEAEFCLKRQRASVSFVWMKVMAVLLVVLLLASFNWAEEIVVAAAADLNQGLPVIAEQFERESGNRVKLSFGSSGNFFAQLQNGAPFDVFLSADIDFPKRLEAAGLTEPGSLYEYAVGKIVLWVPNGSGLDVSRGMSALLDPQVRKIAIANPMHAPYGKAAMAALQHEQLYGRVKDKLVLGENISQTFELAHSGNADVGIVALSLVVAPKVKDTGRFVAVPPSAYPPIRQGVVVIGSSQHKEAAKAFIAYLKRPETITLLKQYGFEVPGNR
jgi:molybdate transport system substrate-binding protein